LPRDDLTKSDFLMFDSLPSALPGRPPRRRHAARTALKAALGVGYAATAMPIMAQTAIKTPADGLTCG
jgi:carboxymethylenebutenolidase